VRSFLACQATIDSSIRKASIISPNQELGPETTRSSTGRSSFGQVTVIVCILMSPKDSPNASLDYGTITFVFQDTVCISSDFASMSLPLSFRRWAVWKFKIHIQSISILPLQSWVFRKLYCCLQFTPPLRKAPSL
jgi:hypothetical protein